jgi:hypothetical protein
MGIALRRRIVVLGALVLFIGLALSALTTQEAFSAKREVEVDTWTPPDRVFPPQDSTFYARLMQPGMWFQLAVSSTDSVRLTVSLVQSQEIKTPVFNQVGTNFDQIVTAGITGTYWIDIVNVSPSSITIEGVILSKGLEEAPITSSPLILVGAPLMIIGTIVLVYGVLKKKPRTLRSKRSDLRSK